MAPATDRATTESMVRSIQDNERPPQGNIDGTEATRPKRRLPGLLIRFS